LEIWFNFVLFKQQITLEMSPHKRVIFSMSRTCIKLGNIPNIGNTHPINQDKTKWRFYVPSIASAGAKVCAIRHNKDTVPSAFINIDLDR
jgi:hypothetical protein